ncbi:ABC transporter permease subunit [Biomaibacter acetigenes]|uniref:ABC transporter permease subunit n=1 Tax=Biomaibacter acetigenes TaxID=2316383 RepID=A0A3G2RBI2_9FIRM|nr:ABC transporter permease subunit [Biomaibacter acetigenes]AYO32067.1 ABC transporter permease subunit [Biomaibacter acetigenes]MDN5301475.1 sulfonate transport system permease protein [Thermoanaerobacteraceae bacterium]RKL62815.1 ABC transporter permease subunit [Thermoanaerobacteraceae bacterium SP2]
MRELLSKVAFIIALTFVWELMRETCHYSELLLPGIASIGEALWTERWEILGKTVFSLKIIAMGLSTAVTLAAIGTFISMSGKMFSEIMTDFMAIMHPLPGIAILPVAILWFGIGIKAILFVIIFSAVWPLINHFYTGFRSIPANQLEVGRNLGLSGVKLALLVMLPASFPHILGGLRTGWARAWQASVAAELVFGAAGGEGGLGWFLYKKRFMMETPGVFAGMVVIILIGIAVEYLIFAGIEKRTVKKWKTIVD